MNKHDKKKLEVMLKALSIFLIALISVTLILFFLQKISASIFWIVVVVCAIAAYWGVPRLRRIIEE